MAKKQVSGKGDAPKNDAPKGGRLGLYLGVLGLVVVGGGGFAVWHRRHDPVRVWARSIEQRHVQKIDQPLARCFGTADSASVRALIAPVREGHVPPALQRCRGAVLMDVMTEPLVLNADLGNVPSAVDAQRNRERSALVRLRTSLGALGHTEDEVGDAHELPPEQRDALARSLEDVAVDIDFERTTFTDLLNAAEASGSMF